MAAPDPLFPVTFSRSGDLYVMSSDGSEARPLGVSGGSSSWSPDGSRIAYGGGAFVCVQCSEGEAPADDTQGLRTISPDGTGEERVTDDHDLGPAWSRDGSTIAFSRRISDRPPLDSDALPDRDDFDVYVMNPHGSGLRPLIDHDGFWDAEPSWSPSGEQLAFTRGTRSGDEAPSVQVFDLEGSRVTHLREGRDPAWSPDGTRIAFVGHAEPGIWVMDSDGTDAVRLTDARGQTADRDPVWSSDGSHIVFSRQIASHPVARHALFVVQADGSELRQLTHPTGEESDLAPATAFAAS